jgi:uncharacterized protein (UPF0335 family)
MVKKQKTEDDNIEMGNNSGSRLLQFIERVEKLEEEKTAISEDIKDVYAEAKGTGFDAKIIRTVVKRRKMDADKRQEEDYLLDTYESAIANLNSMME